MFRPGECGREVVPETQRTDVCRPLSPDNGVVVQRENLCLLHEHQFVVGVASRPEPDAFSGSHASPGVEGRSGVALACNFHGAVRIGNQCELRCFGGRGHRAAEGRGGVLQSDIVPFVAEELEAGSVAHQCPGNILRAARHQQVTDGGSLGDKDRTTLELQAEVHGIVG